jgi:5-hydroxyisourate hydrolase-like protein (transthyretin family)
MLRMSKWTVAASLALAFVFGLSALTARAADEKGSVTVTVTGKDGKPAENVEVGLMKPAKAAAAAGINPFEAVTLAKGGRPEPVAQGTTDKDGKCTLKDVPVGDYQVVARNMADKTAGRGKVSITAGATAMVSIELKDAPKKKAN